MSPQRAVAALAGIFTALLLQATLIAPLTAGVVGAVVSLPAVLVAAVAMIDGIGAGMSLGFTAGLLADLGSAHPVGVLALGWMLLGIGCGTVAEMVRGRRGQVIAIALAATVVCTLTAIAITFITGQNVPIFTLLSGSWLTLAGDALLAAVALAILLPGLASDSLRRAGSVGRPTIRVASAPSDPTVWSR